MPAATATSESPVSTALAALVAQGVLTADPLQSVAATVLDRVARDAARLRLLPDHEAGDVLQEQQRDAALAAQLDEVGTLER